MGFARLADNLTFTDLNPVFAEQYGMPEGNVIGKPLRELVPWLPEQFVSAIERNEQFHFPN